MESSAARQASSTTHPELRLVRDAAELLPDPLSRFIGRETERREVARILEGTRLLFYGSWNGRIIFDEPMITKAVLESRETVDVTLPPAARYASEGLRAGGYRVYYNEATDRHRVALTQLAER